MGGSSSGSGNHHHSGGGGISHFQNAVVPGLSHPGIHLPMGMLASSSGGNPGINDLTAQLAALAQQSGLALTPAAAAATASFMALTAQNNAVGSQSITGVPNLAALVAAIQGGAVQNPLLSQFPGGGHGSLNAVPHSMTSHTSPGARAPPNNNGGTVLIVSNLNEEVSICKCLWCSISHFYSFQPPTEHNQSIPCSSFYTFFNSHSVRSILGLSSLVGFAILSLSSRVFTIINFVVSIRLLLFFAAL